MSAKARYVDSFRNKVIQMVIHQGQELNNVARQFGIPNTLLSSWIDDLPQNIESGDRTATRLRKIQRENWELKRQNDLLKKVIDHLNQLYTTR